MKPMDFSAVAVQRREMMDLTETGLTGVNHHYYRRVGSFLATMHGLTREDVRALGLWNSGELERHYLKHSRPKTYARLSGFANEAEYDIPRSTLNIEAFLLKFPEADRSFFSAFMPFVYDSAVENEVKELKTRGMNQNYNVLQSLRYMNNVFYQDLLDSYQYNSQDEMFSAEIFRSPTFKLWLAYCEDEINAFPQCKASKDEGSDGKWRRVMERRTMQAHEKLDRIVYMMQSHPEPKPEKKTVQRKKTKEDENPGSGTGGTCRCGWLVKDI